MNAILNHLKPRVRYEPICSQVNDIWSHWKGVLATKLPSARICNSCITNNLCKSMPSIVAKLSLSLYYVLRSLFYSNDAPLTHTHFDGINHTFQLSIYFRLFF